MTTIKQTNVKPPKVIVQFDIELREIIKTPYFISRCGHYLIDKRIGDHITLYISTSEKHTYLSYNRHYIHRLVARAWVHNPCPEEFTVIDHINLNPQDNDRKNLRWISRTLNALNKNRKSYATAAKFKKGKRWCTSETSWISKVQFKKKPHTTYFDNEKDACRNTKRVLNALFNEEYDKHAKKSEETRDPFKHYWREGEFGAFMRPDLSDT